MISGPFQAILFIVTTWNPESNCTCREKNHFIFHWNASTLPGLQIHPWMYCWRHWRLLELWWRSRIVRCMDRFHTIHYYVKNHRMDIHGPGERLTRKQTTSRRDTLWPEIWKLMSDASKRKEKQKWAIEKPKTRQCHKIGRVVLRGDTVKDDSGSYAVFTEQGSSASQMTAAKVMDISSRPPGCEGQAADAVSVYTQVKLEDAPSLFRKKFRCQNVQIFGYVYQKKMA